jgi:hypothetical protein
MAEPTRITAQEIERAAARVGNSPRAQMRWAVEDFIAKNLDELTEGDWLNLEHEFYAFATRPSAFGGLRSWQRVNKPISPPSKDELRAIQDVWRRLVTKVRKAPEAEMTQVARLNVGVSVQRFAAGSALHLRMSAGDRWESIATPSFILLLGFAYLIRECEECDQLFMAARLKQTFCSRRCKTRVSVRKFRENQAKTKKSRATSAN